jgi:hypothetical protein
MDLKDIAASEDLVLDGDTPSYMFSSLFDELSIKYSKTVAVLVLIDEYNAPILNQLEHPQLAKETKSL